ncbi:site-2 protease family protein [Belliella kenyensis]|uniref:Site-2 protease family protein n=1 Tax=Belliella kenyensis TaxID=1472724 RepID=A0ABV8EF11_9BACT|nr:site-2 protease family protein [Belliella kenyensis]MCH7401817.1 site-2 protease family protein [Belliella kenyensis]MDN3604317.1 site-2 protease family protein [Belliella kenyensis]
MYSTKEYIRHFILFFTTLICTTFAGGEWLYGRSILGEGESFLNWEYFLKSLHFSVPFIGILLIHELGHWYTSMRYGIKSSLPYFIPAWFGFLGTPSLGTFGAVIRIKSFINSRKKFFDIGVAGPLAGFVLTMGVLIYGFTHLPDADYIYEIHPEYLDPDFEGHSAEDGYLKIDIGYNLLFYALEKTLADPEKMPVMSEIIHFPYLFAGYLALFFTALNLLPIGQLDGGHVVFGLFPKHHFHVSLAAYIMFISYAGLGIISPFEDINTLMWSVPLYIGFLYICFRKAPISTQAKWAIVLSISAFQYLLVSIYPTIEGYSGWLFFAFLLGRVMGIQHPEVSGLKSLNKGRKIIAWITILIFILCFTPQPFQISV